MSEHVEESESVIEKTVEKIHGHNASSSDSDDEKKTTAHPPPIVAEEVKPVAEVPPPSSHILPHLPKPKIYRLFGRQQPVHAVLGGGKPADILLWRNKKISIGALGVATITWVLFELLEYHLLTLVCHALIFLLAVLFLWSNATTFINKTPPYIPEVQIPDEPIVEFVSALRLEINQSIALLREIASGKELKKFLSAIAGLWVVSVVGNWFNFLTLFYIIFVLLHTLPVLYEKYEDRVDAFAEKVSIELKKHYAVVDANVLSKIRRGLLKGRKSE